MSRWAWHEKYGTLKGHIKRASDTLTATQLETEARSQHQREYAYQHANAVHPLYAWSRECARSDCEIKLPQTKMRWVGSRWLCPEHFLEMALEHFES
jgi:hypothetical protein